MRITSGILKGRQFTVPKTGVRPTTERTREAVFSSLAAYVPNSRVLDLFAGAGGLGLEAWSRGAQSVTAVEQVSKHWKNLDQNFRTLETDELGSFHVVRADAYEYLNRSYGAFDLIFADPPYDEVDLPKLLDAVGETLTQDGILVFEMHKRDAVEFSKDWKLLKEKKYGSTKILFLSRSVD